jgi:uncharacterized DUF497 family protein
MLDMCMNTCIIPMMKVTWDEAKHRSNLRKHSMDLADAEAVFAGATFTFEDNRFDHGEQRFITLGMLKGHEK